MNCMDKELSMDFLKSTNGCLYAYRTIAKTLTYNREGVSSDVALADRRSLGAFRLMNDYVK